MNKKIILWVIVVVAIILAIAGGILLYTSNKTKSNPEEIWKQYISYINEQNYEKMYDMLTEDSKAQISKDDFISRNKNIYDGIDMTDMKVEIIGIENEDSKTSKITYNSTMDTEAGQIDFQNTVRLTKNKDNKNGYEINWSSSLIFPQLSNTDKVKIKTISAERGSITDKDGQLLAGKGSVSSVGIVPGKLGEMKI